MSFSITLNGILFGFSVIYVSTNYITRRQLWNKLSQVTTSIHWTYIEDFNCIVNAHEYRGSTSLARQPMTDFFKWTDANSLILLPTLGNLLSWNNGRKGRNKTEKRLDRVVCNLDLLDICNFSVCNILIRIKSDHHPILFSLKLVDIPIKSQFRFMSMWTKSQDCTKIIEDSWKKHVVGCPMYVPDRKLKLLKNRLKDWNKNCFGDVQLKVSLAEQNLKAVQEDISVNGYTDSK